MSPKAFHRRLIGLNDGADFDSALVHEVFYSVKLGVLTDAILPPPRCAVSCSNQPCCICACQAGSSAGCPVELPACLLQQLRCLQQRTDDFAATGAASKPGWLPGLGASWGLSRWDSLRVYSVQRSGMVGRHSCGGQWLSRCSHLHRSHWASASQRQTSRCASGGGVQSDVSPAVRLLLAC